MCGSSGRPIVVYVYIYGKARCPLAHKVIRLTKIQKCVDLCISLIPDSPKADGSSDDSSKERTGKSFVYDTATKLVIRCRTDASMVCIVTGEPIGPSIQTRHDLPLPGLPASGLKKPLQQPTLDSNGDAQDRGEFPIEGKANPKTRPLRLPGFVVNAEAGEVIKGGVGTMERQDEE